jgi:hypothetical protein
MSSSKTMDRKGHLMCKVGYLEVRQKITMGQETKSMGKTVRTKGSTEVMIYHSKKLVQKGFKDISVAVQKAFEILKSEGKENLVCKQTINRYGLV